MFDKNRNKIINSFFVMTLIANFLTAVVAAEIAEGEIGISYSNTHPLYATKINNAVWHTLSGTLPQGISLDSNTGSLVGNTWQNGSFAMTIVSETSNGNQTRDINLTIKDVVPTITSARSISIKSGTVYKEQALYQIETISSANWYEQEGLPDGLYLNSDTGLIYGVANTPGQYSVKLTAKNHFQRVATTQLALSIVENASLVYFVTNTSADPTLNGSLPWALAMANLSNATANIHFNLQPNGNVVHKITLLERLWINETVNIDATTQSGYAGKPLVQIDINGNANAFTVLAANDFHEGGSGSTIAGLQFFNFKANAIATEPKADNVTIKNNYIGFYRDSEQSRWWRNFEALLNDNQINTETKPIRDGYTEAVGIGLQSSGNIIKNNVISGVHNGISIGYDFDKLDSSQWGPVCQANKIINNFIGTTPDGLSILTNTKGALDYVPDTDKNPFGSPSEWKYFGNNSDGIYLSALAKETEIGNNTTSGNFSVGIELLHETVEKSKIYGNKSGVDVNASYALPNGELGIILSNGAHDNMVGGELGANIFSGNFYAGIELGGENSFRRASHNIIRGNLIGCDRTCSYSIGNQRTGIHLGTSESTMNLIEGNTIVGNEWGIYLDKAIVNTIIGNYIGLNKSRKNIGNKKPGIVLDHANDNILVRNFIQYNGHATEGHEDWFFGIWGISSEGNKVLSNDIKNNKTGANFANESIEGDVFIDVNLGISLLCANYNSTPYKAYLSFENIDTERRRVEWKIDNTSLDALQSGEKPENCLQIQDDLSMNIKAVLNYQGAWQLLNLKLNPLKKREQLYWETFY